MKKVALIIFTSVICLGSYAQLPIHDRLKSPDPNARLSSTEAATCPADSSMAYQWNTTTSAWDLRYKQLYTYNKDNYLTSILEQDWNKTSNAYENSRLTIWTYDLNNNQTSLRDQMWNSTDKQWLTYHLITSVFDEHNNVILRTEQLMNNSVLTNNNQTTSTYNSNNLRTTELQQLWDIGANAWVNSYQTTYFYSVNGRLNNSTEQKWNTVTNSWIDYSQAIVTYNPNGDRDIINQTWNTSTNTWVNSAYYGHFSEETTILTDGKIIKQRNQNWNASNDTWVDYTMATWNYDAGNNLTEFKYEEWNDLTGLWEEHFLYLYQYDTDNNLVLVTDKYWNYQNNSWEESKFENYYDCTITEVVQKEMNETIQVSPNPNKGQFNFSGLTGENTIIIYDLQGRQVHQFFTMDKTTTIILTGEKSGIYFYRAINNKNQIRTGKLIIE